MRDASVPQHQPLTDDLRRWIVEQSAAGHGAAALLQSMQASGWQEAAALQALQAVLGAAAVQTLREAPALAASSAVPEPLPVEGVCMLELPDRSVQVLASMREPRLVVMGGFLSSEECDGLMELAQARLSRSETVQPETGATEVNSARTSEGMFFGREENALCARIEARIAALTRWPLENGEGLQVLRYRPGAEYKPHYDYFDVDQPGTPAVVRRGGQRVATLLMYLNTPQRGGATVFPDVRLDVAPLKGNAVFFSYARPHPSTLTLHGGAPVVEGEKWVATKWLRQARFD